MRVLVTGFGPFGGFADNPSEEAVRILAETGIEGVGLVTEVLPVEFAAAPARIGELVRGGGFALVVCTGVAGRDMLTLERVAVNLVDARIPDAAGLQPVDVPVSEGGPSALFTTLPVEAMARAIRGEGIDCELSLSAGSYVCNAVMYAALQAAPEGTRAGFVHVPPADRLAPADAARAIAVAVTAALRTERDDRRPEGRED